MNINNSNFKIFPLLTTDRLLLRKFHKNDTAFLYEIRSNRKIAESMGVKRHCSISETEEMINNVDRSYNIKTGINWVMSLKDENTAIGYVGIWKIVSEHLKGEIGYALNLNYVGNGYMTEALIKIIDFSFSELGLHRLEANIDSNNFNSIRLLKKLNFKQEAFLKEDYFLSGSFHNSIIMSKLENE